jgi:hypothetical protein
LDATGAHTKAYHAGINLDKHRLIARKGAGI